MSAQNYFITGSVQGVFFRSETQKKALALGVTGWVRNNTDGSVEIHAEGTREALRALEEWCRRGPSRAKVEKILIQESDDKGWNTFEIQR